MDSLLFMSGDSTLSADKYSAAVVKAREIVSLNSSYRSNPQSELKARIASKMDRLLGFLLSQFRPHTSSDEVRPLLEGKRVNTLNEDELATLPDGVIPVAIVRDLLYVHKVMLPPGGMSNWLPFANRYHSYIL